MRWRHAGAFSGHSCGQLQLCTSYHQAGALTAVHKLWHSYCSLSVHVVTLLSLQTEIQIMLSRQARVHASARQRRSTPLHARRSPPFTALHRALGAPSWAAPPAWHMAGQGARMAPATCSAASDSGAFNTQAYDAERLALDAQVRLFKTWRACMGQL